MRYGFPPAIIADARAMSFVLFVTDPMQKQIAATNPIAMDAMLNNDCRLLMISNVKVRGGALLRRPS